MSIDSGSASAYKIATTYTVSYKRNEELPASISTGDMLQLIIEAYKEVFYENYTYVDTALNPNWNELDELEYVEIGTFFEKEIGKVSRRLLAQGDMHEVNNLLGRGYSIAGRVEEGKQVGRTIGFPTANITIPPHKALPAFGVYACYLETSGGIFPAVVNVGRHPTMPEGHVTVEAHVLDEFLSLYGRNVRLTFLKFMRPEQKFDSIESLRAQIAHDADDCRAYFAQLQ